MMEVSITLATARDAPLVTELVWDLTAEIAGAIEFYRGAGFVPVGGRKMRRQRFAG